MLEYFVAFASCGLYFSSAGHYPLTLKDHETVTFNLQNGSLTAIAYWTREKGANPVISVVNLTGTMFTHNLTNEKSVRVIGQSMELSLGTKSFVQVWVIPTEICTGNALLYSTSNFLAEDFTPLKKQDNICVFFSNLGTLHLYVNLVSKNEKLPTIQGYTNDGDTIRKASICKESSCHTDISQPFFLMVKDLDSLSSYRMDYNLEQTNEDEPCSRINIPGIIGGQLNMNGITFKQNTLTCDSSSFEDDNYLHFIVLMGIVIVSLAGMAVMYVTGCCASLSGWCSKSIGNEGPAPIKTEPNELLRDQLNLIDEEEDTN